MTKFVSLTEKPQKSKEQVVNVFSDNKQHIVFRSTSSGQQSPNCREMHSSLSGYLIVREKTDGWRKR